MKLSALLNKRARISKAKDHRWPEYVGVELELENVHSMPSIPLWHVHNDDSLRNGIEYVFSSPLAGTGIDEALNNYFGTQLKHDSSQRSSTHIHVNMTDSTTDDLKSLIMITYALEDAIYASVGEGRKWAGYSMPLREMHPKRLRLLLSPVDETGRTYAANLHPNRRNERYYGMNVMALTQHGTVEFRYFPGGPSREELEYWLDLVTALKRTAKAIPPAALVESMTGVGDFIRLLSDNFPAKVLERLFSAVAPDQLYNNFNDVAMLFSEENSLERADFLVFLSPSLLRYVRKRYATTEAAGKYLDQVVSTFGVLSGPDWQRHLSQLVQLSQAEEQASAAIAREQRAVARLRERTIRPAFVSGYAAESPGPSYFEETSSPFEQTSSREFIDLLSAAQRRPNR